MQTKCMEPAPGYMVSQLELKKMNHRYLCRSALFEEGSSLSQFERAIVSMGLSKLTMGQVLGAACL